jgi:hypothetical protein
MGGRWVGGEDYSTGPPKISGTPRTGVVLLARFGYRPLLWFRWSELKRNYIWSYAK